MKNRTVFYIDIEGKTDKELSLIFDPTGELWRNKIIDDVFVYLMTLDIVLFIFGWIVK